MKQVIVNLVMALILFLAPIRDACLCVIGLVTLDLFLGMVAAYRRKEPLSSRALGRTGIKALVYLTLIIVGYITQKYLIGDLLEFVKYLTMFIGLTELTSIVENLQDITGMPILKTLISKISSKRDAE